MIFMQEDRPAIRHPIDSKVAAVIRCQMRAKGKYPPLNYQNLEEAIAGAQLP